MAAAAGTVTVIAIAQTVGGDPATTRLPAAAPGPAWPADPDASWALSTPGEATISLEPSTPSPSPSTSTLPAPRTTTPRPPTTAPAPAPAPVKPALTLTAGSVPALVDLSAEGTRDWAHFGLTDATSINRRGDGNSIEDLGTTGGRGRYENNPQLFTWTGGRPTGSATRTPTGVYACGEGSGFTLRVPAGPETRTLRLYAGVWMASGRLTTTLNGLTRTSTLENREAISTNRFEIRFRAPAGSKLTLTWKATDTFHPSCGNVDMQAATLS
ncbi:hypothetical protein SAMN04489716_8371 [Actinoplanes derwentensis]|uniref:Uncharacterized protein n=1 Tax=Actinoplanes derwentensis TaxID=113562 RepID=A0A1H2D6R3_9ACTN|nr:hypothetical protein SAMN04489716_8371 [Actinoplanes derwentensis]